MTAFSIAVGSWSRPRTETPGWRPAIVAAPSRRALHELAASRFRCPSIRSFSGLAPGSAGVLASPGIPSALSSNVYGRPGHAAARYDPAPMRIAVVGVGGVGGYFGGRLAEAGEDVVFVARGETLAALRERGLVVESIAGDFHLAQVAASADPAAVGPVDAVLLGVKAWQVADVAPKLRPLLGPETFVVPLQNGVEAPEQLAAALGSAQVVGGVCRILATQVAPGVIRHAGVEPTIAFGESDGGASARTERLRVAFGRVRGVTLERPADIRVAMWEKLLFIVTFGTVGAATRSPAGVFRALPETRALLSAVAREVLAVGRARGVPLYEAVVGATLAYIDALPPQATSSMQRDLADGRPSELEAQTGAVVRLGREAGVPTPVSDALYAALLPGERRARGQ